MRFALLGSHPDGLEMACALVESGRHELAAYAAAGVDASCLRRWGAEARPVGDVEEVLADPMIEAVIVAGIAANRPEQLRRALQSERHVLCVHPVSHGPDVAYEAAMIQGDTGRVLFPLLPDLQHPGIHRLRALAEAADGSFGAVRLLEAEFWSTTEVLIDSQTAGHKPSLPGWDILRALRGEIAEVAACTLGEELAAELPLLLTGRFERGELFRSAFLPSQHEARRRFTLVGSRGCAELLFPLGWPGPAYLSWRDGSGALQEESWDIWDPWPTLVAQFESAINKSPAATMLGPPVTWQDAVRCLELDDAVRRSLAQRRSVSLDYPEATEEAGFKGTMTLVGCGLVWLVLVLVIASNWLPWLGWAIAPLLVIFLALQLLRWIVPRKAGNEEQKHKTKN